MANLHDAYVYIKHLLLMFLLELAITSVIYSQEMLTTHLQYTYQLVFINNIFCNLNFFLK